MIKYLFPADVVTSGCVCDFHKKNPGKQSAGCTCISSWTLKTKPVSEEFLRNFPKDLMKPGVFQRNN